MKTPSRVKYSLTAIAVALTALSSLALTAMHRFQLGTRVTARSHIATGDSLTALMGGVIDPANSYVMIMARKMGLPLTNLAVAGYQSEDWVRMEIFPNLNPIPSNNPIVTALIMDNDQYHAGVAGLPNANSAMLAGLTWATIPINSKVLGDQATSTTGTWAADTSIIAGGVLSSTNGSSKVYTITTTTPHQAVYIWYGGIDASSATASVKFDAGSITDTIASSSAQCICTLTHLHESVWAKRYVMASAGTHTMLITITSDIGSIRFLGLGTPLKSLAPTIGPPSIFVASPNYGNGLTNRVMIDQYRVQLEKQVALLQGDGLLVGYVNTNLYLNNATDMTGSDVTVPKGMGDNNSGTVCSAVPSNQVGPHPNICGQGHIADAFLRIIQPATAPGLGYGTMVLGTLPIASGTCVTTTQVASGATLRSIPVWGFHGDPTGATGYIPSANGMLTIVIFPSVGFINVKTCNNTTARVTPGAVTLNWKVE